MGLHNTTESGFPNNPPNQLSPSLPSSRKSPLRDLHNLNHNPILVSKSSSTSPFLPNKTVPGPAPTHQSEPDSVELSGSKTFSAHCLMSTLSPQQCPITNAGNAHLVYVRRKPEVEPVRSTACDNHRSQVVDHSQLGKTNDQDEVTQNELQLSESKTCTPPQVSPISKTSSLGFSSAKASPENSTNILSPTNLICLHANPTLSRPIKVNQRHWEGQRCQLKNLLKKLDQSDQEDYIQLLRSLSSVELSKHAVELEKRSIKISLEEAKELQRVRVLDVLERYSKHSRVTSTPQSPSEK